MRCGGGAVHIFYRQLPCNVFLPCLLVSLYSGHNGLHAQLIKISNTVLCTDNTKLYVYNVVVLNNMKSIAVFFPLEKSSNEKKDNHAYFIHISIKLEFISDCALTVFVNWSEIKYDEGKIRLR